MNKAVRKNVAPKKKGIERYKKNHQSIKSGTQILKYSLLYQYDKNDTAHLCRCYQLFWHLKIKCQNALKCITDLRKALWVIRMESFQLQWCDSQLVWFVKLTRLWCLILKITWWMMRMVLALMRKIWFCDLLALFFLFKKTVLVCVCDRIKRPFSQMQTILHQMNEAEELCHF